MRLLKKWWQNVINEYNHTEPMWQDRMTVVFLLQVLFGLTEASRLFVMSGDTILEQPETCQDSAECPLDFCCRGRQGNIVDSSGTFDVIGPLIQRQNGTCNAMRAQIGEKCNEFCPCDNGLECFHPLIGDKFVPMTCRDRLFVEQEIEKFAQCYQDNKCELPILADSDS